jgi:IclR family transcriptional regulator, acetate operon repressor
VPTTSGVDSAPVTSQGGTQAVDRAAALLTYVVEADHPVTFAEVTEAAGLARSTTSRLLSALERTQLLERSGTGEYVGGPVFVRYAARHDRNKQLAKLALPVLEEIGEQTGESVHLAVASGERVDHIAQVDTTFLLGARDWTDVEIPAHSSALGKVLLAWGAIPFPSGGLATPTEHTLSTLAALDRDLRTTRERGYATTRDELEIGLTGVAAPVFGPELDGATPHRPAPRLVAAVGVSGPTGRFEDRIEELARLLVGHGQALTELLQHGTHPHAGPERETA